MGVTFFFGQDGDKNSPGWVKNDTTLEILFYIVRSPPLNLFIFAFKFISCQSFENSTIWPVILKLAGSFYQTISMKLKIMRGKKKNKDWLGDALGKPERWSESREALWISLALSESGKIKGKKKAAQWVRRRPIKLGVGELSKMLSQIL